MIRLLMKPRSPGRAALAALLALATLVGCAASFSPRRELRLGTEASRGSPERFHAPGQHGADAAWSAGTSTDVACAALRTGRTRQTSETLQVAVASDVAGARITTHRFTPRGISAAPSNGTPLRSSAAPRAPPSLS